MSRGFRNLCPMAEKSAGYAALGTANTGAAVQVPGTFRGNNRPVAFYIYFLNSSDVMVRGRVGLSGTGSVPIIADNDDTLGHVAPNSEDYYIIPSSATHLIVASAVANAKCYITWLYER